MVRATTTVWMFAFGVAGCGAAEPSLHEAPPSPARTASAVATDSAPAPSRSPVGSPPPDARAPLPPVTVARPEKVACQWEDRDLGLEASLALDPGAAPYVAIKGNAKALLAALPVGGAPLAWGLDATVDGVTLRGHAPLAELPVALRAGVVYGKLYVPDERVSVQAVSGESGAMTTAVAPFAELELRGGPLTGTAPCASYGLTSASFEARASIYSPAGETMYLVGDRIPISTEERGAIRGFLRPLKGPTQAVELIGSGKQRKRVVWTVNHGVVFGWVPATALSLKEPDGPFEAGGLGLSGMGPGGIPEVIVCAHPVGLRVAVGERREVVGAVQADTPMVPSAAASPGVGVTFTSDAIAPKNGAIFYVDPSDIADCTLR